ncbi:hypothetical protein ACN47E_002563 [Coniothyrium glycines]
MLLFTGASAAILFASNDSSPSRWHIGSDDAQPQVYISVLELIITLFTAYALGEGLVISFWTQLLQGTSIANLHDSHASSSFFPAIRHTLRLQITKVGISTLLSTLSLARGPIFQRALSLRIPPSLATTSAPIHTTSLPHTIIGILLSLLACLSILPLYHNFWLLGRPVSLHPLEIARAFSAPLLEGIDGNASANEIELQVGGATTVRYGAVEKFEGGKVLRIEKCTEVGVRMPRADEVFA